jgi:hypothetical protein
MGRSSHRAELERLREENGRLREWLRSAGQLPPREPTWQELRDKVEQTARWFGVDTDAIRASRATATCRLCNGEKIAPWPPIPGGGPTHHTCHPGEERPVAPVGGGKRSRAEAQRRQDEIEQLRARVTELERELLHRGIPKDSAAVVFSWDLERDHHVTTRAVLCQGLRPGPWDELSQMARDTLRVIGNEVHGGKGR